MIPRRLIRRRLVVAGLFTVLAGLVAGPRAAAPQRGAQGQRGAPPARGSTPPQTPRPSFRADVEAVQLDLRVIDRNGNFIKDLKQSEFQIFEDGAPQTITNFGLVEIPFESAGAPESPLALDSPAAPHPDPDIASNAEQDGRLYVIVLDDLEGQANPQRAATVRALASQFIEENFAANDRAALITTSGRRDMAQEFTNSRQRLLTSVAKFEGGYGQVMMTPSGTGNSFATPGGGMATDNLRSTMITLTSVAKWLAQIDGRRKSIVLVSERLGRPVNGTIDLQLASNEGADARDFVAAAARGNVSLYVVDPVGVPSGRAPGIRPPFIDDGSAFDAGRQQSLIVMAEATGGFAATRSNDYAAAFSRIVAESSAYYVMGYVSTNQRRDGKYRKVEVRVTRPNLRVLARSGYVAPKGSSSAADSTLSGATPVVNDLLKSPVAVSGGLPLTVTAPVFRSSGGKHTVGVVVESGANRLLFSSAGGRFNAGVTMAIVAADMGGKIQAGERGALTMRLSPETRQAMMQRGARVISQLDLKPGRYALKVAALDAVDGTTRGSIVYGLDVPDFDKSPLSMSGVVISSLGEPSVPTVARDEKQRRILGPSPTARRSFSSTEELQVTFEAYSRDKRGRHTLVLTTSVLNASGASVYKREQTSGGSASGETSTHRATTAIQLRNLASGAYVLQVEARSNVDDVPAVSKQVPFSVK